MTTTEAAQYLGASTEAVRKMHKFGRLKRAGIAGRTILIDADSVHRVFGEATRSGRLWTRRTAWAALSLLSGLEVSWLSSSELWRLRKRLSDLSAEEVHQLARNRAVTRRFRGGESAKQKLSKVLATSGVGALSDPLMANSFGLAAGSETSEGYAKTGFIANNALKLGLREEADGDILIRELEFIQPVEDGQVPVAAVAVDLMDSMATRERSAGRIKLEELLNVF